MTIGKILFGSCFIHLFLFCEYNLNNNKREKLNNEKYARIRKNN